MADEAFAGMANRQWTLDQAAIEEIEEPIELSVQISESTIDGFATMTNVEESIEPARPKPRFAKT
jgi:hypothetical protein